MLSAVFLCLVKRSSLLTSFHLNYLKKKNYTYALELLHGD